MALLFVDGFDHYVTADGLKKWNAFGASVSILPTSGRRGLGALSLGSTRFVNKVLPAALQTVIVGMAYDTNGTPADSLIFRVLDGASVHLEIQYTGAFAFSVYRGAKAAGGALLGSSANAVLANSGFSYVEFKVTISDTVGAVEIRVNGASVLSLSNVDTRNAGNASLSSVSIYGAGGAVLVDDVYICDTSGSANNDFLGDCRIDTLYPNADGTYSDFTPSTGTAHYALVDEAAPNTTDYNESATVGHRDSYAFGNLSALVANTVYGVQVNAAINKDDAGVRSAATMVRSGGTDADGASATLLTSQTYLSQIFETNPNGAVAWVESAINAAEFGVKVTA